MKEYNFKPSQEYIQNGQHLASLVLNPPYKVDGSTSSPRVSKLLNFPFGIRISRVDFFKHSFRLILSMSLLMLITSIFISFACLPIEAQNNKLITSAKNLTKEKYLLEGNLQETSSYNRLFSSAESLLLKDTENIIYLSSNNIPEAYTTEPLLNKYPLIQFAGF